MRQGAIANCRRYSCSSKWPLDSKPPRPTKRAVHAALRALTAGEPASPRAEAAVRRSLVETLRHGDRAALVRELDDVLLGLRSAAGLARTA